jgi:hypothetical protein
MAEASDPRFPGTSNADDASDAFSRREAWFTTTPDPWREITKLSYGSDRTYGTTVHRMIVNAEPDQHAAMETKLLEALAQPELTDAGRAFVCRMLGLVGSRSCVVPVARLLEDDRTADLARSALDFIPDNSVDEAYRAALPRLTGAAKLGLLGSMAMRGSPLAVEDMTGLALDETQPEELRSKAERVVEKISSGARP